MLLSKTAVQTPPGNTAHGANGISHFHKHSVSLDPLSCSPSFSHLSLFKGLPLSPALAYSSFQCFIHVCVYFTDLLMGSMQQERWRALCRVFSLTSAVNLGAPVLSEKDEEEEEKDEDEEEEEG